ncbi:hypothetical protein [Flammeovirga agarivorans]|uniref:Uncharacterized protein n=1 Tax=Flammeovirga agarivorans TaxID=2726742 RepID=A0A7X8SHN7_9BACT|nr:hypothetical protein [Flammeovirga agarivorans]NLR90293.1 hypothetical protein [Flammeovirga agarivorans]
MKDFDESCECARDNFCRFVQGNKKYTNEEMDYLIQCSLGKGVSKILRVGYVLVVWSFVAVWIDNLLFPGALGYSFFKGEFSWVTISPLLFLVGNATLKALFIKYRLKDQITVFEAYWASIPYIGFAFLLRSQFKKDKILYVAAKDYFFYQKNLVKKEVKAFFGFKTKDDVGLNI